MLLARSLRRMIRTGRLIVIDATGEAHAIQGAPGPTVTVRLHDRVLHWKLVVNPHLYMGEAYVDGTLTIEDGSVYDLLSLIGINIESTEWDRAHGGAPLIERLFRRIHQFNPLNRARKNVAHHYDLSSALFDLFLDADKQYSCAYFRDGNDDLDTAQHDKMRHIAVKLLLQPGHRVLDIGSGWGGLALHLARHADVEVTGLTLSTEQAKAAEKRAADTGLSDRVRFHLRDYRQEQGRYDRIVSVGMFEHVGVTYYRAFFERLRELLTEDGVALLHTIGRADGSGTFHPWLRKYIFPGAYSPALSEVLPAIEELGLTVTDIEVLRLHYAETLRHWRQRFVARWDDAKTLYDERFCRMWEFYLASCEMAFRHLHFVVFQIQMAKQQDAVPLTRDYVTHVDESDGARARDRAAA